MKKEKITTQLNRLIVTLLMGIAALTAHADDGDLWEAPGVIAGNGTTLNCTFSVVSEEDATVKFVQTPGCNNTFTDETAASITMLDEVEHDGKTYTVVEIGNYAFFEADFLLEVRHISAGVKAIGWYAFCRCSLLKSVNLPEGLESIQRAAFQDCLELTATMSEEQTDDAFYLPSSLKYIGAYSFASCQKADIRLNEGLQTIAGFAFEYCNALIDVTIPSTVTLIDESAFSCCDYLQNIFVHPDNTQYYDIDGVLYDPQYNGSNSLLQFPGGRTGRFDIDDRTQCIRRYAFLGSRLTEVFVPMTVGEIRPYAFCRCENLNAFYVEWTGYIPSFAEETFDDYTAANTVLYIPDEATGMTAVDILDLYLANNANQPFAGVECYTPKNTGLRIAGNNISRTKTFGIETGVTAGTVNYEIANRKLILTDATIEASGNGAYGIENLNIDGLTIELNGTNTIRTSAAGMFLTDDNTIVGPGELKIESGQAEGILISRGRLDIVDATLDIISSGGDFSGEMEAYVNITNSSLKLRPTGSSGVATVHNLTQMTLSDSHFSQPMFAEFWPWLGCVVDRHGKPVEGYITIEPSNGYELYVGTFVTEDNKDDITCNELTRGKASYDPDRNILTLDNVRIVSDPGIIYSRMPGLIVKLVGYNTLLSSDEGITLYSDAVFTGDGFLQVTSDYNVGILIENDYTKLDIRNTTMTIYGAQGAIYGSDGGEERSVEVTNSNVILKAATMVDVTKYLDNFELYHCHFYDLNQYFDPAYGGICTYNDNGRLENYYPIEIVAEGQTTSISLPDTRSPLLDSPVYDLQGRRINNSLTSHPSPLTPHLNKGIYIIGTRKVVIK